MGEPQVLLESYSDGRDGASFAFDGYVGEVVAHRTEEVLSALSEVEQAVGRGLHAAGFVCYEAAPGLDADLVTHTESPVPLLWFGLFRERHEVKPGGLVVGGGYTLSGWTSSVSKEEYVEKVRQIQAYIEAGDTYQVNYTFRMRADFEGDARALYRDLCAAQRSPYAAYVDTGRFRVLSASPELFFSLQNGVVTARPMKGTARRGRWSGEDERLSESLRASAKERAENVMIVDLLRNDLGRVSVPGSVEVPALWEVERYETVLQMTSTVTSRLRPEVGLAELLSSLFPCGSVTGAPKVRTMQVIREMEDSPRGVYTGSIGFISPGLEVRFNVAIRTVWTDRETGRAEFGVGSGVTHDSRVEEEYEECSVKARMLTVRRPEFELFETIRYDRKKGFLLLDRHLDRLEASAGYWGFRYDGGAVERALVKAAEACVEGVHRVRLLLERDGSARVEYVALQDQKEQKVRAGLTRTPVDSRDPMLFHKTTDRKLYDVRRAEREDCDEVILVNEKGEMTECSVGNLVAVLNGRKVTPALDCGLLPGTFRAALLEAGELEEGVLTPVDLKRAEALYMINSVREWVALELVD